MIRHILSRILEMVLPDDSTIVIEITRAKRMTGAAIVYRDADDGRGLVAERVN